MPAIRAHGALPHKATCMILNLVARVERSDTWKNHRRSTAHKKADPEVGFLFTAQSGPAAERRAVSYSASRLLAPSTRRAMPSGLAFFRASGSSASGQFW